MHMRDDNRPRQELVNEVIGLRKQVQDLKDAAVARWRAEQAVRRSEEEYRSLVEEAPGGICRLGPEGQFEQLNVVLARLVGYETRSEALEIARTFGGFVDEAERQRVLNHIATAGAPPITARFQHRVGDPISLMISGRPLQDPDGSPAGYILFVVPT